MIHQPMTVLRSRANLQSRVFNKSLSQGIGPSYSTST